MAYCILSMIVDTDNRDAYVLACMVHTEYAPCSRDGEPASPIPLHAWTERDPDSSVAMWALRTGQQRPLLIHNGDVLDVPEHHLDTTCWCSPEVRKAVLVAEVGRG